MEPLSASLVRSVAAVTSHASVTTVTMTPGSNVGDDDSLRPGKSTAVPYIPAQQQASSATSGHQERALRYFSMTQSGDPGHSEPQLNSSPLLPESRERVGAPPAPTSFTDHRQQREVVEEQRAEEEDRGRQQGGAREEKQGGSIKGTLHTPDRNRDARQQQQQHPHPLHAAEPSLCRGKSEALPSWGATDRDSQESRERAEGGGRGRGGYLREAAAAAAHSSSTQEQERSSGWSQTGISGRRLH